MYKCLLDNRSIDQSLQKGFFRGIDGVIEHTSLLSHIMKDAKHNQRSLKITLLGIKNAVGEVRQNLIVSVLQYYHLPNEFIQLFLSAYNNNFISVSVDNKWTNAIKGERGLLQGDPSSPLLFNLGFDTLIQTLNQ